jgi:hypothetical protein
VTLRVHLHPETDRVRSFGTDRVVRVGRAGDSDVVVGGEPVDDRWTVSKAHLELRWDGSRWNAHNVSDKPGLLTAYEPGYEDTPVEPGRRWSPVGPRWSHRLGRPDHPFHVVCTTDDHDGNPEVPPVHVTPALAPDDDDDPTAMLETLDPLPVTALEQEVLRAYYGDFVALPRPPTLAPRAHHEAARRLGRSTDSTRKAVERINAKIARLPGAPPAATGRAVSAEIGRWLARTALLEP